MSGGTLIKERCDAYGSFFLANPKTSRCKLRCDVVNRYVACFDYVIKPCVRKHCRDDKDFRAIPKASQIFTQASQATTQTQIIKKPLKLLAKR